MDLAELLALLLGDGTTPADLSGITDEDLAAHEQTLIEAFAAARATARGADALAELARIADAADAVRNEAAARIDAAVADQEAIAALEARLVPVAEADPEPEPEAEPEPEPEPEGAAEPSEPVRQDEREPVLAGAVAVRTRPSLAPLGSLRSDTPPADPAGETRIRILADPAAAPNRLAIAEAFIDADRYLGASRHGATVYQPVINVQGVPDPARRLQFGNQQHNDAIVASMFGRPALLAAGGFCGPATPYYNLMQISSAVRPVHDGLNALSVAGRGALQFNAPMALADFAGAITQWTNDNANGEDNSPSEKACATITCTGPTTEEVRAFVRCLTIENFMDRYSPEMVAQALDLTMVNWAMESETYLLDRIKAASTAVTEAQVIGAAADLNYTIGLAAAGFRNSSRMLSDVGLRVLLPAWVLDMYIGDIARADHHYAEQLRVARATVEANLANLGVRPIFYIDTPSTGTTQKFGAQSPGALNQYPSVIQWALFHEGAHVPLDGGPELNFGVVRDSAGNAVNTYQSFGESFEGYAFLGVKSWWITQNVCPSGTFSAPTDLFSDLCGAS